MRTEDLITALAADARPAGPSLGRGLLLAVAAGGVVALILFAALLGLRGDLGTALGSARFLLKFLVTGTLAAIALTLALRLARPGARPPHVLALLALPAALLAAAVAGEIVTVPEPLWASRLVGRNWAVCLAMVPLLSLGPLGFLLWALKRGAPDSPLRSGLLAGLGAGAMGAFVYAAHCPDDSPLFVAVWYTLAVGMVTALGGCLGRRLLRW